MRLDRNRTDRQATVVMALAHMDAGSPYGSDPAALDQWISTCASVNEAARRQGRTVSMNEMFDVAAEVARRMK